MRLLIPAAAAMLAGCAAVSPYGSYVGDLPPAASGTIGADLGGYVATTLPAGKSVVWVGPAGTAGNSPLGLALENTLRSRGFAVAPDTPTPPANAHEIRYFVTPVPRDWQANATVTVDGRPASRAYVVDQTGSARPIGPFSVLD